VELSGRAHIACGARRDGIYWRRRINVQAKECRMTTTDVGSVSKRITIDRTAHLNEQPRTGHNRWHPEIDPVLQVDPGEVILLETRDALDGYLNPQSTVADFASLPLGAIHPLTGPVFVNGAKPGDLLEIEFIDIQPQPWAFSAIMPGLGFLRDTMTTPFLVHWRIADGWATSEQLPGVRIPGAPFMGVSGVAPSLQQVEQWTNREAEVAAKGGMALPPNSDGAVPAGGPAASQGLSTLPPRENGGNFDVKQLTPGSKLLLPVNVDGALFSTGDAHFAQGDGEVCVTAVEMAATCTVRFAIRPNEAALRNIRWPRFSRTTDFADPRFAMPRRFTATMGMPVDVDGTNHGEDLTAACRAAVNNMLDLLQERGYTREQAYVISSVAVDLRISNVVDVPNYVVSALLPEDIFVS
jgi:formamidase